MSATTTTTTTPGARSQPPPATPRASMSSTTKTCLIAALALTAALSIAILGLSARHIAFVQNRHLEHHDLLNVSYRWRDIEAYEWRPRVSQMRYLPSYFTMVDTYLMLVAGIVGAVLAPFNLFIIARRTDDPLQVAITGRKVRLTSSAAT